jgi:SAM-dependent methyltransferase
VWLDLAERLNLRLRTPRAAAPPLLQLTFEPLDTTARVLPAAVSAASSGATERYGADSAFARISKHEDPSFVLDLADALDRIDPRPDARILALGIHTGDELALLLALRPALAAATIVGVDLSPSAIDTARRRFAEHPNVQLLVGDATRLAELPAVSSTRFDLVLSIGLFQSGALDDRALLRTIVQHVLAPSGAVLIGMPNCRYIDGEVSYGARMKNFTQPELGLVIKDIAFYRKYLQQHHMQVFVTGKHYLLVTAIPG